MKKYNTKKKLFEVMNKLDNSFKPRLDENNIYINKYHIKTIDIPLIPDAIEVLSNNKNAIEFHDKLSFDDFANKQKYFSASQSHCFYTENENSEFSKNGSKYIDPDSKKSKIVFETGHELVQVWDNKNNIGYVLPFNKTDNEVYNSRPKLNELDNYQGIENSFENKLDFIIKEMIKNDYGYDDILEIIKNILQKQP